MKKLVGKQLDLDVFGEELRKLILSKGYKNLNDFHNRSAQVHISMTTLHDICNGNTQPIFNSLINLSNALEMSHAEFFAHFSYTYLKK